MLTEDGLEPTDVCNDCAWDELDDLRAVISKHLPALKKMAGQVIDPPRNVFSKMVVDFEKALRTK